MDFRLDLHDETVTLECMSEPVCCSLATPIREVFAELKNCNTGAILVCDDEEVLKGIFTERDALRLMAANSSLDRPVSEVMTGEPNTISSATTVGDSISQMSSGGYRRLPVIDDDGKPVGVVKTSSLVHYLVTHFPDVVYNLPPDPHHVTQEREGA